MPEVQRANRSALFLSAGLGDVLEHARVGDWCFEYENIKNNGTLSGRTPVLYLIVPGAGHEPELVKLYMYRTAMRWDEPGPVTAWNGNLKAPTLIGSIQTPHWIGLLERGRLWTEDGESSGRKILRMTR